MSQQQPQTNHYRAFEDLGRSIQTPDHRSHRSTSGTPRPVQVNPPRVLASEGPQVTLEALASPQPDHRPYQNMAGTPLPQQLNATRMMMPEMSRTSDIPGSDVSRPASGPFHEDEWQHTPAPDDESQGELHNFPYESSIREAPVTPGYTPEHSEGDHIARLKLWAEKVTTRFELKASQFSDLSMFIELGRNLDTGDLRMRIWQLATNYKLLNGMEEIKAHTVNTKNAVETATAGIRSGFQLSTDQMSQVLIISKDLIVQAGRTKYKALHVDVEERLRSRADSYGFQNVFGNPTNERVLRAVIKKECSAVQNKFRTLILDSTGWEGKTRMMLEELTWTALSKYKRGGVGSGLKAEHQLHLAYLRYYGRAHQYLVGPAATEESGIESREDAAPMEVSVDESVDKPPAKHARSVSNKAPPGRVKKGRDFWSAMDRLFMKDIEQYARDMKNEKWRNFFNDIIIQDQARYGRNASSILPPLPSMYTEPTLATAPSGSRPSSTVVYHGTSHMSQTLPRQPSTSDTLPQAIRGGSDRLPSSDSPEDLLSPNF
ncbi:hypothetical protein EDD15DRAFT_2380600 [Pisolithus albus]|nr:hypothetical protein EDD15DRAFT_2380600 [Pisolithus albus]